MELVELRIQEGFDIAYYHNAKAAARKKMFSS